MNNVLKVEKLNKKYPSFSLKEVSFDTTINDENDDDELYWSKRCR